VIPQTLIAGGGDSRTQHPPGLWPGVGRKRPGVGTQTLVPLNFSAVVATLFLLLTYYFDNILLNVINALLLLTTFTNCQFCQELVVYHLTT